MNFSLIFPSNGNKEKIKKLFDSIERTTRYKDKIEVLVAIDDGKTEIIDFIKSKKYSFRVEFFERPQTDNFSDDYYNWLANKSCGDNIWALNDDVIITTQDWDKRILLKIKKFGWSVYLVDTTESTREIVNKGFCCFPIISRRAVNELGFFFYPQVRIYPADKVIYMLFERAGCIINARDIKLQSTYIQENKNPRLWNIYQEDRTNGALNVNITVSLLSLLKVITEEAMKKKRRKWNIF